MRITKEYLDSLIENGRNTLKPDEGKGIEFPELVKANDTKNNTIALDIEGINDISNKTLSECIENRKSTREFSDEFLTFQELSYLIWEINRVKEFREGWTHRPIPSAGGRHCLETYIYINKIEDIIEGLYQYLPIEGRLALIDSKESLKKNIDKAMFNQM